MIAVWIALAGGAGALARFVLDGAVRARLASDFPWATVLINVTGSFALGVLTGLVLFHGRPDDLRLILGTGFCGGYTTFSTASVETVRLAQRGAVVAALGNALGTLVLAVGAGALGLLVTR
ncbi:fluoride efflux transporter CrcB [uncultured Jatrophihabitans sp.]|uniref:fluoride efflux transporter CrcB n=1 Tax=uncultured Jatrophihabitans sp. TaxID=1610747 RepID=UPI0035CB4A95